MMIQAGVSLVQGRRFRLTLLFPYLQSEPEDDEEKAVLWHSGTSVELTECPPSLRCHLTTATGVKASAARPRRGEHSHVTS